MTTVEGAVPQPEAPPPADHGNGHPAWIELTKILALPLVTLVLGYWFNSSLNERQQVESNIRLYAEMTCAVPFMAVTVQQVLVP